MIVKWSGRERVWWWQPVCFAPGRVCLRWPGGDYIRLGQRKKLSLGYSAVCCVEDRTAKFGKVDEILLQGWVNRWLKEWWWEAILLAILASSTHAVVFCFGERKPPVLTSVRYS